MKTKRAMLLSWFATLTLGVSLAFAAPHGGRGGPSGGHMGATRGGPSMSHGVSRMRYGGVHGSFNHYGYRGSGHWRHRGHYRGGYYYDDDDYAFFPFWGWGYPYSYYYPYDYGYYYPYGYYYSYNNEPVYDNGYAGASIVVQMQQRLAREGYYHSAIDGIVGPATRRAIRSYERDHDMPVDGRLSQRLLERMDLG